MGDIFERTLLGTKVRVFNAEGTAIQRLSEGFAYFEEWTEELIDSGVFDNGVSTELFLSWQVQLRNADTFGPVKSVLSQG